jgi:hypothetical protein
MRRILAAAFGFIFLLPINTQGQEWSAEQQELWAWEVACWEDPDLEANSPCFHEDFVGWGVGVDSPTTRAERRALQAEIVETTETTLTDLEPLSANIYGNTAILIYVVTFVEKDKATGDETTHVERWTDVAVKEAGQWFWVADHGTIVEGG